jgi:hypothetical protein
MNDLQKKLLENELKLLVSKAKITLDNLEEVRKKERKNFVETKVLQVNDTILKWALKNVIVDEHQLENVDFFEAHRETRDRIIDGTLVTTGVVGSGTLLASVTAANWAGLGGGIGALTVGSVSVVLAPVFLSGFAVYGTYKYKEKKNMECLVDYFDSEKEKILIFYLDKIQKIGI